MKRKGLSFLLAASLVLGMLPAENSASAAALSSSGRTMAAPSGAAERLGAGEAVQGTFGGTKDEVADTSTPDTHSWKLEDGVLTVSTLPLTVEEIAKLPADRQENWQAIPDFTTTAGEDRVTGTGKDGYRTAPWFPYREQIKKIVFTGDITAIGAYAFGGSNYDDYSYPVLTEIDFTGAPKLTKIGRYAFCGGKNKEASVLKTIKGSEQITELSSGMFWNTAIEEINFPGVETVTALQAFAGMSELQSATLENVTQVGANMFSGDTKLETVSMPKLQQAGSSIFSNTSLKEIHLPKLETAGQSMFDGCKALKEAELPMVATIGKWMFKNCESLETISLPGVKEIGARTDEVFWGCTSLYQADFPNLKTLNGGKAMFRDCVQMKSLQLKDTEVTSGVEGLSIFNFMPNLTWAQMSPSMCKSWFTAAGRYTVMFNWGLSLKRLYLDTSELQDLSSNSVIQQSGAFKLAEKVDEAESVSGCTIYAVKCGEDKLAVEQNSGYMDKSTVSTKANEIDDAADCLWELTNLAPGNKLVLLDSAEELEKLAAKENVLRISQEDYYDTDPVEPEVVENKAGEEAAKTIKYYYYVKKISSANRSIYWELVDQEHPNDPPTEPGDYWVRAETEDTENWFGTTSNYAPFHVEGETLSEDGKWGYHNGTHVLTVYDRTILEEGFASEEDPSDASKAAVPWKEHLSEITSVVISDDENGSDPLDKVGAYAFYGLSEVTSLPVANMLEAGRSAFQDCTSWKPVGALTVNKIEEAAFRGCRALSVKVTIADGVTEVPAYAFYFCRMREVSIPDTVQKFGENCFGQCPNLTSIHIPNGVEEIPGDFINGASQITQIELPESVVVIGDYAFAHTGLTSIQLPNKLGSKYTGPAESEDEPSAEEDDSDPLAHKIPFGDCVFYGCSGLESVEIPESLTVLSGMSFNSCGLKVVTIPKTVTSILGKEIVGSIGGLFGSCPDLQTVVFENTEYTKETLGTTGIAQNVTIDGESQKIIIDGMFKSTPESLQVICDGSTYDVLKEYAETRFHNTNMGWTSADVLHRPGDFSAGWQEDLETVQGLQASDYDAELWENLQDALTKAQETIAAAEKGSLLDQIAAYNDAQSALREAAKQILLITYRKSLAIAEEDYADEEDDESMEAWYAFEELREMALGTLNDTKVYPVSQYINDERALWEAMAVLKPVVKQTAAPGGEATVTPGSEATDEPGGQQTAAPGGEATNEPGGQQTVAPDGQQTATPEGTPSTQPDTNGTAAPSIQPSGSPDVQNTAAPTKKPSSSSKTTKVKVKKVTVKKVSSKKKKTLTVQWKKVSGATGYQIVIGLDKKMKKGKKTVNIKKAKTLKTTIKKLKSKKKYFVKVRAYKTVKGKKHYGSWSKVKTVKVK